jgi:hypothetical protein
LVFGERLIIPISELKLVMGIRWLQLSIVFAPCDLRGLRSLFITNAHSNVKSEIPEEEIF